MRSVLGWLQPLGRALMLPIAVLPIAGLLLRLGQPDLLNIPFVAAAGDAIFSNLGLLFAIGVAVGLAKDNNGAAGLAGAVCFLVASKGAIALLQPPRRAVERRARCLSGHDHRPASRATPSPPAACRMGLLSGIIAGYAYNRFHTFKLPEYLAFFGGRRFVPIISGLGGLGAGAGIRSCLAESQPRHRRRQPHRAGAWPARAFHLRRAEPAADRRRPAPHPEQFRLFHHRRLITACPATSIASSPAIPPPAPS